MTTPAKTTTKAPAAKTSRTPRAAKAKSATTTAKRPDSPELAALRDELAEFQLKPGEEPWDWTVPMFTSGDWDTALADLDGAYRTARVEIHGDFERAHAVVCKGMQPCWERPEWHGLGDTGTQPAPEGPRHRRRGVSVRLLERVRGGLADLAAEADPADQSPQLPPGVEPLPQRTPGTSGITLPPGVPFSKGSNVVVHTAAPLAEIVPLDDKAEGAWLRNMRAALKEEAEREETTQTSTAVQDGHPGSGPAAVEGTPGPAPAVPPAADSPPQAGPGAPTENRTEDDERPGKADPLKVGKWHEPGTEKGTAQ